MDGNTSPQPKSSDVIGSPAAPALKRRPLGFALAFLAYAAWMAVLIYWAIQLHHGKPH